MQKFILRPTVAFTAFLIGIAIAAIQRSPYRQESKEPAEGVYEKVCEPQPMQTSVLLEKPKTKGTSDLSIEVVTNLEPLMLELRHIKLARHGTTVIELDLGEGIDGQEVTLHLRDSASYRILQRYRTTMSVAGEGPHLDLVDWRHFDSPWTPLKSLGSKRFRTLRTDQMEDSKFPSTTKAEIIKEVRRHVGNDWPALMDLVQSCEGPNDGPCWVGISSIYLRIQKQINTRWVDVGLIEVKVPMGC